jgi:hypothetical protein
MDAVEREMQGIRYWKPRKKNDNAQSTWEATMTGLPGFPVSVASVRSVVRSGFVLLPGVKEGNEGNEEVACSSLPSFPSVTSQGHAAPAGLATMVGVRGAINRTLLRSLRPVAFESARWPGLAWRFVLAPRPGPPEPKR